MMYIVFNFVSFDNYKFVSNVPKPAKPLKHHDKFYKKYIV